MLLISVLNDKKQTRQLNAEVYMAYKHCHFYRNFLYFYTSIETTANAPLWSRAKVHTRIPRLGFDCSTHKAIKNVLACTLKFTNNLTQNTSFKIERTNT